MRDEDVYFEDIPNVKVPRDMLDLAKHILASKKARFDPSKFEDRYEKALTALIKAKRAGKAPPEPSAPPPSNVVNLMDALRRSVAADRRGAHRRRDRRPRIRPRKRSAARRGRVKRAS